LYYSVLNTAPLRMYENRNITGDLVCARNKNTCTKRIVETLLVQAHEVTQEYDDLLKYETQRSVSRHMTID